MRTLRCIHLLVGKRCIGGREAEAEADVGVEADISAFGTTKRKHTDADRVREADVGATAIGSASPRGNIGAAAVHCPAPPEAESRKRESWTLVQARAAAVL